MACAFGGLRAGVLAGTLGGRRDQGAPAVRGRQFSWPRTLPRARAKACSAVAGLRSAGELHYLRGGRATICRFSLCANIASAPELDAFAIAVAACPLLALLLSVELLSRALKRHRFQAATFHSFRILP